MVKFKSETYGSWTVELPGDKLEGASASQLSVSRAEMEEAVNEVAETVLDTILSHRRISLSLISDRITNAKAD